MPDYRKMAVESLRALAREKLGPGHAKKAKGELVALLEAAAAPQETQIPLDWRSADIRRGCDAARALQDEVNAACELRRGGAGILAESWPLGWAPDCRTGRCRIDPFRESE
jgi:hypothetical protein